MKLLPVPKAYYFKYDYYPSLLWLEQLLGELCEVPCLHSFISSSFKEYTRQIFTISILEIRKLQSCNLTKVTQLKNGRVRIQIQIWQILKHPHTMLPLIKPNYLEDETLNNEPTQ